MLVNHAYIEIHIMFTDVFNKWDIELESDKAYLTRIIYQSNAAGYMLMTKLVILGRPANQLQRKVIES